jgi:monoamine oxidase
VNEGMQTILKNYSKLLNIALNKEVIKIIWKKNKCLVITSDKQKYYSEKVLITIPIAILQKNITTLFEPSLPQSKIESIFDFNIKPATKLFFLFTKLFWDKSMIYMCNLGPLARWWTPYYGRETPKNEFCIV